MIDGQYLLVTRDLAEDDLLQWGLQKAAKQPEFPLRCLVAAQV